MSQEPNEGDLVAFNIDAKPTDDDDYNWMHTMCETAASGAVMFHAADALKVVGGFRMYRDLIQQNLEAVDYDIAGQDFVRWKKADRQTRGDVPDKWVGDMWESLDEIFIDAVTEKGMDPAEAFDHYDRWVTTTREEFERVHDEEGFFERVDEMGSER